MSGTLTVSKNILCIDTVYSFCSSMQQDDWRRSSEMQRREEGKDLRRRRRRLAAAGTMCQRQSLKSRGRSRNCRWARSTIVNYRARGAFGKIRVDAAGSGRKDRVSRAVGEAVSRAATTTTIELGRPRDVLTSLSRSCMMPSHPPHMCTLRAF